MNTRNVPTVRKAHLTGLVSRLRLGKAARDQALRAYQEVREKLAPWVRKLGVNTRPDYPDERTLLSAGCKLQWQGRHYESIREKEALALIQEAKLALSGGKTAIHKLRELLLYQLGMTRRLTKRELQEISKLESKLVVTRKCIDWNVFYQMKEAGELPAIFEQVARQEKHGYELHWWPLDEKRKRE